MKKIIIFMLSCFCALLLCACSGKGGNNDDKADKIYDTGAVFEVRKRGDFTPEDKTFPHKNGLKTYIAENFFDNYYFLVLEESDENEIFDNIGGGSTVYVNSIDLYLGSDECLVVYNVKHNATAGNYSMEADMPLTSNVQSSIELKFGVNKNYSLTANVILMPAENKKLALDKTVQKHIEADKIEYFSFTSQVSGPLNFTVKASREVEVGLYEDDKVRIVGELLRGTQVKASYFVFADTEYYLAVHSYGSDCDVEIGLKNVESVELDKEKECTVSGSEYFTFTPQISSEVIFGTESSGAFTVELYDDDNKLIAETDGTDNFSQYVEKEKKYYILVTNCSYKDGKVKIYTRVNPVPLSLGSKEMYQPTAESCYAFTSPVSAEYLISLTANECEIYNSAWERVTAADGGYALNADSIYFIIIKGSVEQFTVNIDLYYTVDAEGVIPESGEIIVKFVPTATAEYSVDGAESVEWYDRNLLETGSALKKDKTYFVKIKGEAGTTYSIKKEYVKISVDRLVNLYDGAYSFTAESGGEYTVMFYCGKNTVNFTLYDNSGAKIKEYSGESGEITLNLSVGDYTFDLAVSEPTSAGVIIKPVNQ